MIQTKHHKQAGYTLPEVLIYLVLLGLLSYSLITIFSTIEYTVLSVSAVIQEQKVKRNKQTGSRLGQDKDMNKVKRWYSDFGDEAWIETEDGWTFNVFDKK